MCSPSHFSCALPDQGSQHSLKEAYLPTPRTRVSGGEVTGRWGGGQEAELTEIFHVKHGDRTTKGPFEAFGYQFATLG